MPLNCSCAIANSTSTTRLARHIGGLRRGSAIASWLLDLTAAALIEDETLSKFIGRVTDSGEGRWTIHAAIDEGAPVPVLSTAVYECFSSCGEVDYQDKLLSAMRYQFGGHVAARPVPSRPLEESSGAFICFLV